MNWFSKMNTPNKLTVIRIICVIAIVIVFFLPLHQIVFTITGVSFSLKRTMIIGLYIFGAFTDHLDGKIARKRNIVTTFGKFLDPIADKILVNVLFILLAVSGEVHSIVPVIFVARDTLVDAVRLIMIEKNVVIAASSLGKAKTVSQMIALVLVLFLNVPFESMNIPFATMATYFAVTISVISGYDYVYSNRKTLFEGADYNGK